MLSTNLLHKILQKVIIIIIAVPKNYRKPRFVESLRAVLTKEGLVSFECKVVGYPTPLLRSQRCNTNRFHTIISMHILYNERSNYETILNYWSLQMVQGWGGVEARRCLSTQWKQVVINVILIIPKINIITNHHHHYNQTRLKLIFRSLGTYSCLLPSWQL